MCSHSDGELIRFDLIDVIRCSDFTVAPEIKWKGKRVEETVIAGFNATAVYWKILDP